MESSVQIVLHGRWTLLALKSLTAERPVVLFVRPGITLFCGVFDILNTSCSFTICFTVCLLILIYSPSVMEGMKGMFILPNITIASVMACRLVRELKLGRFDGPMTELEGAMSRLVFTDIAGVNRHEVSFEQRGVDDADIDTRVGERGHVLVDGSSSRSEADIELGEIRSRTDG